MALTSVTLWFAFASGTPASAHAVLETSSPADQSVLPHSPSKVTLTFGERVTLTVGSLRVYDGAGKRVDVGLATHGATGAQITVGLKPHLPTGSYAVAWRVISEDSHPVHGGLVFSVRDASAVGALDQYLVTSSNPVWEGIGDVLRALGYLGSFLAVGAAVFLAFLADDEQRRSTPRRLPLVGAAIAAAAMVLQLPVQALLATGQGIGSFFQSGVARQVLAAGVGLTTVGVLLALGVAAGAMRLRDRRASRVAAVIALALLVGAFVASGHTRSTRPPWLTSVVNAVHVAGGVLWVGGLAMLLVALRSSRREAGDSSAGAGRAAKLVVRFSHLATGAIVAIGLSGLVLGWLEVGSFSGLLTTGYGRLVLAKAVALALVGLIGAYNHFRLVPAVERRPGGSAAWRQLSRTMRWEAVGMVVILGLTGVLVNAIPARTELSQRALYSGSAPLGQGSVNVVIQPAHTGYTQLHIYLLDAQGRADDHQESVSLDLTQTDLEIGPITRPVTKAGPGHYQGFGKLFTVPGTWQVLVRVRVDEFTEQDATLTVKIRG